MTEETTGQQPAPQGETATITTENPIVETTAQTTEEKPAETPKKEENKNWYIDVITGLRHNVRDTNAELEKLKAENAALKAGQKTDPISLTEQEIDRRAAEKAEIKRFNEKCDSIAQKGEQEFPTFRKALENLHAVGALGPNVSPAFLQTVAELPEAHKLINHLGNNPDEAARIASLPPVKMALELAKVESGFSKPKEISKAPAPIKPITGNGGGSGDLADPNLPMVEYSRIRAEQRRKREEAR